MVQEIVDKRTNEEKGWLGINKELCDLCLPFSGFQVEDPNAVCRRRRIL